MKIICKNISKKIIKNIRIGAEATLVSYPIILEDGNTEIWADKDVNVTTITGDKVTDWEHKLEGYTNKFLQTIDSKRPILTSDGVSFDGLNNYMKSNAFTLAQPTTFYLLVKWRTFVSGRYLFDGITGDQCFVYQSGGTNGLKGYNGSSSSSNYDLTLNKWGVITVVFNGVSSKLQIDKNAPTSWSGGSNSMGGVMLGSNGYGSGFSDIIFSEVICRKIVDSDSDISDIVDYLIAKKTLPDTATDLSDQGYDSAEVDRRLIYLSTLGLTGELIDISGNDARTTASDDAVELLVLDGNVITGDA